MSSPEMKVLSVAIDEIQELRDEVKYLKQEIRLHEISEDHYRAKIAKLKAEIWRWENSVSKFVREVLR